MSACCETSCPVAGSLLPIAYITSGVLTEENLLDLLVTTNITAGVVLGFRFFPGTEGYQSRYSSSVSFVLPQNILAGGFLRLRYDAPGVVLLYKANGSVPEWATIGNATQAPALTANCSCLVYWSPDKCTTGGIAFIGIRTAETVTLENAAPVPPPCSVVPCEFQIVRPAPGGPSTWIALQDYVVPGKWINAWQIAKWSSGWTDGDPTGYELVVDNLEATLHVSLQPGQLIPVAFKPYLSAEPTSSFGGEWALVVTEPIPANTSFYLFSNAWDLDEARDNLTVRWTTRTCVPAGTVVDIVGFGTNAWRASIGHITVIMPGLPAGDIYGLTAYTAEGHAITATYTCVYEGPVPTDLIPGVSMPARPWPNCASILPTSPCHRVCNWLCERVLLNALTPKRWITQPLPAFLACKPRCSLCCVQKMTLPSTCPATTPIMSDGGGCRTGRC